MNKINHRKPLRLTHYDYSQNGYYFVTVCEKYKRNVFGYIDNSVIQLNEMGKIALDCWMAIPSHFKNVELDEFIIMPNHIHGIIVIDSVGQRHAFADNNDKNKRKYQLLPKIMGAYKSAVTKNINAIGGKKLFQWQSSYYDHIIRNKYSINQIRKYIINNPIMWEYDRNNVNSVC